MKVLDDIKILQEIKENLQRETKKLKENKNHKVFLFPHEIDLFLKKVNVFKFTDRISIHYNINSIEKLKNFLKIPRTAILNEKKLKLIFKNNHIIEQVLTNQEKIALKKLYIEEYNKKNDIRIKKEAKEKVRLEELISLLLKDINVFLKNIPTDKNNISKKKLAKYKELKHDCKMLLQKSSNYSSSHNLLRIKYSHLCDLNLRRNVHVNEKSGNHKGINYKEKVKEIERLNKIKLENLKKQEEKELIEKIKKRNEDKNKEVIDNNNQEEIIIEAFLSDFNSEKSRFSLSVLNGSNIKISFFTGIIKFLNNEGFNKKEIFFRTNYNTITFFLDNYEINISLNTNKKIIDILQEQTNQIYIINSILDSLSVLYYINTFYTNKEKIEINDSSAISNNEFNEKKRRIMSKNIIYLSKERLNSTKTKILKIKKEKSIEGKSLTRGHWRRQPYSDGTIKLIWIEPFWRGKGKIKEKTYKLL